MPAPPVSDSLARLEVLVGDWSVEAGINDTLPGTARIGWVLDRTILRWEVMIPDPRFPNSFSIISSVDGGTYLQHYFDARGIARLYKMTLDGDTWTLLRDESDFTTLDFAQRFTGTVGPGGDVISGDWMSRGPDGQWRKDFDLVYRRIKKGRNQPPAD